MNMNLNEITKFLKNPNEQETLNTILNNFKKKPELNLNEIIRFLEKSPKTLKEQKIIDKSLKIFKIIGELSKLKINEKKTFENMDLDAVELQDLCRFLKGKGYYTYVSSGNLSVQKGEKTSNLRKLSELIRKQAEDNFNEKIIKFFQENPNPKDDQVHEFADKNKISPHELETKIYSILSEYIQNGTSVESWEGKGKNLSDKDVDPTELKMGIEIEKEHTKNPEIARRIAIDHLEEISDYYTRLKKMESEAKS